MLNINKVFTDKIISIIVIITFTVTSICYGIDLPKKSHLRVPVGESSTYKRLMEIREALKGGTRKVSNDDIKIAIYILQEVYKEKLTIKKVAKLLHIEVNELLLAEERGEIDLKAKLAIVQSVAKKSMGTRGGMRAYWRQISIHRWFIVGVVLMFIPTIFTLLALPHMFLHVLMLRLSYPNLVYEIILNPHFDPGGIVGHIIPMVSTSAEPFLPYFGVERFNLSWGNPIQNHTLHTIYYILNYYIPNLYSVVIGFLVIKMGLKSKNSIVKEFTSGIGITTVGFSLFYMLGDVIYSCLIGKAVGDFAVGTSYVLNLFSGTQSIHVASPLFGILTLTSGAVVFGLGYVLSVIIYSCVKFLITPFISVSRSLLDMIRNNKLFSPVITLIRSDSLITAMGILITLDLGLSLLMGGTYAFLAAVDGLLVLIGVFLSVLGGLTIGDHLVLKIQESVSQRQESLISMPKATAITQKDELYAVGQTGVVRPTLEPFIKNVSVARACL